MKKIAHAKKTKKATPRGAVPPHVQAARAEQDVRGMLESIQDVLEKVLAADASRASLVEAHALTRCLLEWELAGLLTSVREAA